MQQDRLRRAATPQTPGWILLSGWYPWILEKAVEEFADVYKPKKIQRLRDTININKFIDIKTTWTCKNEFKKWVIVECGRKFGSVLFLTEAEWNAGKA